MVGSVDVLAGMAVLFAPRGLPLLYMTVWALWTALLRPLSGESGFETLERAARILDRMREGEPRPGRASAR